VCTFEILLIRGAVVQEPYTHTHTHNTHIPATVAVRPPLSVVLTALKPKPSVTARIWRFLHVRRATLPPKRRPRTIVFFLRVRDENVLSDPSNENNVSRFRGARLILVRPLATDHPLLSNRRSVPSVSATVLSIFCVAKATSDLPPPPSVFNRGARVQEGTRGSKVSVDVTFPRDQSATRPNGYDDTTQYRQFRVTNFDVSDNARPSDFLRVQYRVDGSFGEGRGLFLNFPNIVRSKLIRY